MRASAIAACGDFAIGARGGGERQAIGQGYDGVELRIEAAQAVEVHACQLD